MIKYIYILALLYKVRGLTKKALYKSSVLGDSTKDFPEYNSQSLLSPFLPFSPISPSPFPIGDEAITRLVTEVVTKIITKIIMKVIIEVMEVTKGLKIN